MCIRDRIWPLPLRPIKLCGCPGLRESDDSKSYRDVLMHGSTRLDSECCHAFKMDQTKTSSFAERANLLAKHAKQRRTAKTISVSILANRAPAFAMPSD